MPLVDPEGPGRCDELRIRLDEGPPLWVEARAADGRISTWRAPRLDQSAFLDLFEGLARDFGLRAPEGRRPPPPGAAGPQLEPLITQPLSPRILYGYGDPCVTRVGPADYRLLVTSNDAPDAFPILASPNLRDWRLAGFVFPQGRAPEWSLTGEGVADFWAPELHRVGGEWVVGFTARMPDRSLAIGLARAASPDGPFVADPAPLLTGGVIDPHILLDADGAPWLVWKRDDNGVWPRIVAALLHDRPSLCAELFVTEADRRTAAVVRALWPWVERQEPMVQFFALQSLIEAAADDLGGFEARLAAAAAGGAPADRGRIETALAALRTRIFIQRLSPDARRLEGAPAVILQNDQAWEGHLIEGVWIRRRGDRYHLLYAGNDFSTARYGLGAAMAAAPQGPYRKQAEVVLASTPDWWAPGHPSVAEGPDGRDHIFLHAFRPGEAGYKAFRALLAAPLSFEAEGLRIDPAVARL